MAPENEELNNEELETEDLNETFEEEMDDATVITVPIDDTLSNSGEAADAKAVGDALALKADKSELQTAINVNGETADNQGTILLDASKIPAAEGGEESVADKLIELDGKAGYPVGTIIMNTSASAPEYEGTWEEILITMTWAMLKSGSRGYVAGTGQGDIHFWLRTA